MEYYDQLIKTYSDKHQSISQDRINLFRSLGPLTKDLIITMYGSFDQFMKAETNKHPIEEYLISFDEYMFDSDMVNTIAQRMGILITDQIESYKTFIDRVVQILKLSNFTYDDYRKYINMTEKEYDKLDLDYEYDDRLFVFMKSSLSRQSS